MPKTRILVVAYLFPPAGGVGVQRAISFVKYLPSHDCEVFVLTARNAAAPVVDSALLRHIPPQTCIYRAFTPEPSYAFRDRLWKWLSSARNHTNATSGQTKASRPATDTVVSRVKSRIGAAIGRALCPDPQVLWVPFALRRARAIVRNQNIDTVLITAPPFSSFRIGTELKKTFPHLKLISDFRDEWLAHFLGIDSASSEYKSRLAGRLERQIVEASDYVIAVTPAWLEQMRTRYPDQPAAKFACVPNGYDPHVFAGFTPRSHGQDKLVITYLGTVYTNAVYSPRAYLEALDSLPVHVRRSIETRFIGRIAPEAESLFAERSSSIRRLGFMPQDEAIRYLEETDAVLLIAGTAGMHSGKLFEYLATGKPIMALCRVDGEIARVIRETRAGWCAALDDPGAIATLLLHIHEQWSARSWESTLNPDWDAIRAYARPRLVSTFVKATGISA